MQTFFNQLDAYFRTQGVMQTAVIWLTDQPNGGGHRASSTRVGERGRDTPGDSLHRVRRLDHPDPVYAEVPFSALIGLVRQMRE